MEKTRTPQTLKMFRIDFYQNILCDAVDYLGLLKIIPPGCTTVYWSPFFFFFRKSRHNNFFSPISKCYATVFTLEMFKLRQARTLSWTKYFFNSCWYNANFKYNDYSTRLWNNWNIYHRNYPQLHNLTRYILECRHGHFGKGCNLSCKRGYYGYLCSKPCECEVHLCDTETGCRTRQTEKTFPGKQTINQIWGLVAVSLLINHFEK